MGDMMRKPEDMYRVLEHYSKVMRLALAMVEGNRAKINAVLYDQDDSGRLVAEPKGEM